MAMRSSIAAICASCARQVQRAQTPSAAWRRTAPLLSAQQGRPARARAPALAAAAINVHGGPSGSLVRPFSQSARLGGKRKKNQKKKRQPKVLPPLPYYELFANALPDGPPPAGRFNLDPRALHREYLRLQAEAHPDFYHDAGADAATGGDDAATANPSARGHSAPRARAEAASAYINEAYRTLKSPLLRVQYILKERYGVDLASDENTMLTEEPAATAAVEADTEADDEVEDEDKAKASDNDDDKYDWDDDDDDDDEQLNAHFSSAPRMTKAEENTRLLMAVLEVREQIEDARTEADLVPIQTLNDRRREHSEDIIEAALAQEDIQAVQEEAVRLRYWVNIDEALHNWESGKAVSLQH